jgi:hypothetical protein
LLLQFAASFCSDFLIAKGATACFGFCQSFGSVFSALGLGSDFSLLDFHVVRLSAQRAGLRAKISVYLVSLPT